MRISLQPAFILHHRAYRETSLLLDVFTKDYGRISLIARGIRTAGSRLRPLLQPFVPLLISWYGKTELMTLQTAEARGNPMRLKGRCLLGAFYLNELLLRLLQKQDAHPQLYTIYQDTLLKLSGVELEQKFLRFFEKKLLDELGYGLQLQTFIDDQYYRYYPEQGFKLREAWEDISQRMIFSGKSLNSLANEQLDDESALLDSKRLMRIALMPLLGTQPLQTRKMFIGVE